MNRRSIAFVVVLAASLLVVAVLTGRTAGDGPPLDPDSTGPLGTRALAELLEEFDVDVTRGLPDDRTGTALLLTSRLGEAERAEVEAWVAGGGRLVVVSPGWSSQDALDAVSPRTTLRRGTCDIEGLDDVETLESAGFGLFVVERGESGCFFVDGLAFVTSRPEGRGLRVQVGGAAVFTNERLDEADNAVLAMRLLAPEGPSDRSVALVFDPAGLATGERTLTDLVPSQVRWMGWQLLVAFAAFVWYRARRFGRVVTEPQPVELPASILVLASAELRRRSGSHAQAVEAVRRDLELDVRRRYRLPVELTIEGVAATVSARTGLGGPVVHQALVDSVPPTATGLAELLGAVDRVRVAGEPTTEPAVEPATDPTRSVP